MPCGQTRVKSFFYFFQLVETGKRNLQEANETPATDPRASVIYADTLTLLFVIEVFTLIFTSIMPGENSRAVHLIVVP